MTAAQWFWRGYVDGAVTKRDASARDASHRYPDISAGETDTYLEGAADGARGDSWRLQWVAHQLVSV